MKKENVSAIDIMQANMKKMMMVSMVALVAVMSGVMTYGGAQVRAAGTEDAGAGAPQAVPVGITVVKPQDVEIWSSYSGRVVAMDQADIRPQVSGRIIEVKFEDGQHVEKGDVLFVVDPRPYEAALKQAEATLESAKTAASLAEKEYQRAKKLIGTEAISQGLLDERSNNRYMAAAEVKRAQAMVDSAQVNFDYAHVKAPIAGKVSRAEITEGNIVQAGLGAPLLTSIVSDKGVYVDFDVDERAYLELMQNMKRRKEDMTIPVKMTLYGDHQYEGTIQSFDNKIDAATGTVRTRSVFANQDGLLLPGMTVGVEMGKSGGDKQLLVSERAIGTDQDRKFVYVVNDKGVAEYREVTIGDSIAGQRVVISGLSTGERVVTEGIMRIRPGVPVVDKATMAQAPQGGMAGQH